MTRYSLSKLLTLITAIILCGCSSTSNLADGEILYVGMQETNYTDAEAHPGSHFVSVQEEVNAALECAPNGALLGSAYYRSPWPMRLWIYNNYYNSTSGFGKWMRNSFGTEPVLMEGVNPELRASVAKNILRNNGYFNASVDYETIPQKNPKKEKVAYTVKAGKLYVVDTLKYVGFNADMDSIIHANIDSANHMRSGDPFSMERLDQERTRVADILRNNGYYFYNSSYSAFIADSVSNPGRIEVRLQPIDNIPAVATRKWYLGKMNISMRKSNNERITDTISHRYLSIAYSGEKVPMRPRAILRDLKVRPRQLYNHDNFEESSDILNSMGVFSLANFTLTPRDTSETCDTLDMMLNCTFDKPYSASFEANYKIKSNDRTGPGITVGLTKLNAFRGGEKLSLNLRGSYEWQTGNKIGGNSSSINSYEYGGDIMLEYPRIVSPIQFKPRRHRYYTPPSTVFTLKADVINRAEYYKILNSGASVTYKFLTSETSTHEFSPLTIDYNYVFGITDKYLELMIKNPILALTTTTQFIPKIKYTYTYTSPKSYLNPIRWEMTLSEAGNLLSLIYMAAGKKFNEEDKHILGNPYAQFFKVNTDLRKTWTLGPKSQLVGRVALGAIVPYGNTKYTPYMEAFYVGGANSLRGFSIRSVGPGTYIPEDQTYSNLDQVGEFKLECNLEYRFNITGGLYGALFLDAGNVWLWEPDEYTPGGEFRLDKFYDQIATNTGIGVRYDLDFLVLRFDVGCAIHAPYDTGKSGYYNIPKFSNGLAYHFAIGYPF